MTHYEKVMREEIERRNYTEGTTRTYIAGARVICPAISSARRNASLPNRSESTPRTCSATAACRQHGQSAVGALRFFYLKILKKPWRGHEMPYPKKSLHLPVIWSQEEMARLIDAAPTPFYRTIVMTLYATGMRRAELANLKIGDIPSGGERRTMGRGAHH